MGDTVKVEHAKGCKFPAPEKDGAECERKDGHTHPQPHWDNWIDSLPR